MSKTVGITGDMGSGKSLVSKMMADYGVPTYDSDKQAKEILNRPEVRSDIKKAFPEFKFYNRGEYDVEFAKKVMFGSYWLIENVFQRFLILCAFFIDDKLGHKATEKYGKKYSGEDVRRKFGDVLRPHLLADFSKWKAKQGKAPFVMFESAILFESGIHVHFDETIFVNAPLHVMVERVKKRSGLTEYQYNQRMKNQLPADIKIGMATYVIENETENNWELNLEVDKVFSKITEEETSGFTA